MALRNLHSSQRLRPIVQAAGRFLIPLLLMGGVCHAQSQNAPVPIGTTIDGAPDDLQQQLEEFRNGLQESRRLQERVERLEAELARTRNPTGSGAPPFVSYNGGEDGFLGPVYRPYKPSGGDLRLSREMTSERLESRTTLLTDLDKMRREAAEYINSQDRLPDGGIKPNGAVLFCNNFYYDLFTVDDNGLLDDHLLARLKHRDQFQGAMHELFAQATCLRAGFTIIWSCFSPCFDAATLS